MVKPLFRKKKQTAAALTFQSGPPQPDYLVRLSHAEDRIKRLDEQIERFRKIQGNPFYVESDLATGQHIFKSRKPTSAPTSFGLDISECLFHLRSTLDYLAHRLGDVHSGPIPSADIKELRKPEFPIFGDRGPYPGEWSKKIGRAHPDAINIIENMQPYRSGDYTVHPLWVLHELNNIDKHRMITPVTMSRGYKDIRLINATLLRGRFQLKGPLEDGTVVYWAQIEAVNPRLPANIEIEFFVDVGFDDTPVVPYEPVRGWLDAILKFIKGDVINPLTPYL